MRAPHHLNALRAFEAAARHRSYVGAAAELNVTPAAVSQLVRSLEQALGVVLFQRAQSGAARLRPTEPALAALADLQAGFDLLQQALGRLKLGAERAIVRVTVPPALADKWLLGRLERFGAQHPHIELRVETNPRLADFTADQVDVGIRYGAGHWAGLHATRLMGDAFFPVCSPALQRGARALACAADLRHHALIHDMSMRGEPAFTSWQSWLACAGVAGIDTIRGMQVNDSAAVVQAVIAGAGVALGRSVLVDEDLAAGRLVRPFGAAQASRFAYFLVRREQGAPAPAVAAFCAWLTAEAARQASVDH